jgi:hypothetical protein
MNCKHLFLSFGDKINLFYYKFDKWWVHLYLLYVLYNIATCKWEKVPHSVLKFLFQIISRLYQTRLYINHICVFFFIKFNDNFTWDKFWFVGVLKKCFYNAKSDSFYLANTLEVSGRPSLANKFPAAKLWWGRLHVLANFFVTLNPKL